MKQLSILLLFLMGLSLTELNAQYLTQDTENNKPNWKERLYYGGNFGLAFGSTTYIEISPTVGYRVTNKFGAGVGLSYLYYRQIIQYQLSSGQWDEWEYKSKTYGGKIFTDYVIYNQNAENALINIGSIIAHAEIEELNVNAYSYDIYGNMQDFGRTWITSALVGGGIRQPIGKRSYATLLILYNLTEEAFTPYSNPVIRIGFTF